VSVEGFLLTPLLCAAAAARDIGCRPDPTPGSSARDPEKPPSHGDAADDVDDRGAELVTAAGRAPGPALDGSTPSSDRSAPPQSTPNQSPDNRRPRGYSVRRTLRGVSGPSNRGRRHAFSPHIAPARTVRCRAEHNCADSTGQLNARRLAGVLPRPEARRRRHAVGHRHRRRSQTGQRTLRPKRPKPT
jgi:hypothetical protein